MDDIEFEQRVLAVLQKHHKHCWHPVNREKHVATTKGILGDWQCCHCGAAHHTTESNLEDFGNRHGPHDPNPRLTLMEESKGGF